jgi:hypothetical protein
MSTTQPSIRRNIKTAGSILNGRNKLIFILLFLFPLISFGQRFEGGLMAGFNGSQIKGDRNYGFHKFGLAGGAWVQTDINEKVFLSMEIKYNQKGNKINPTIKNDFWLYIYRLNYIDVPVLIGYRYFDYLSFIGGLSFGYLAHSSGEDNYGPSPTELFTGLNTWELGAFVGCKVKFDRLVDRAWAERFILDFRFQFSAIPIYTTNGKLFYYSPYSHFNSVISTSLYYRISL